MRDALYAFLSVLDRIYAYAFLVFCRDAEVFLFKKGTKKGFIRYND